MCGHTRIDTAKLPVIHTLLDDLLQVLEESAIQGPYVTVSGRWQLGRGIQKPYPIRTARGVLDQTPDQMTQSVARCVAIGFLRGGQHSTRFGRALVDYRDQKIFFACVVGV